jgi:hypothetical protein
LVALLLLEVYAFIEGYRLDRARPEVKLGAGPLVGGWHWRFGARMLPAIMVAGLGLVVLPLVARRSRTAVAIAVTAAFASAFALLLAAADGWAAVTAPVVDPTEYWVDVERSRPAALYLRSFLERQRFHTVHVRGHPPGFMLLLKAMRHVGFGSPRFAAALSYVGVGMTVVGVAVVVQRLAGAAWMRRCLPFLALAPYAVWQGTSADAFYTGVACVGIALLVLAMTTVGIRAALAALAGGVVLGGGCFLTYGMPTVAPLVVLAAWRTKAWRWVLPAGIGAGLVAVTFASSGFWWADGLVDTRHWYRIGTAQFRPYGYFLLSNLAVLAIAVGPAAIRGLVGLRRERGGIVVLGGLAAALLADLSGLSKGESERIWLLYMPWIGVAGGVAAVASRTRLWLALQATTALVLQAWLVSKW